MRYGRTSIIHFLSRLVMSFSGFVATIILTRTLGQNQYGTYVVVLSVLAWTTMAAQFGLPQAIRKRVSEETEGNYVLSGAAIQFILYSILALTLWAGRPYINDFVGVDAALVLILMLAARLTVNLVQNILDGQHLVHVSSVLIPVEWTSRTLVQVTLVVSSFGIAGAFAGYIVGAIVAALIGSYFLTVPRTMPSRREVSNLKSFAQFSWLGSIKNRAFQSMDTLILAVFVSHSLIAVYEVAWNLASLFAIFGSSISRTLFPEMSSISATEGNKSKISGLLRVSLAYAGLFIIPGLVGGALVGDVILTIYGRGFETGYYILLVLTFARLLYGYAGQFVNTIDALDHPNLTFYINAAFVGTNLALNVALTWKFGWYGAAAATTVSSGIALLGGYHFASQLIDVTIPVAEIAKQCLAAIVMAALVEAGRLVLGSTLPIVIALVIFGGGVYFAVLILLSEEFRTMVVDNLPFDSPLLQYAR
ncbi:lipopolysaccharide biosynthesis protein [Halobacterium salinarum]|uniref:lipopolysaccharide biosynthesis protein n=1 Tax=Halobacterium salinarum TaxID=2242 RepID=UPI002554D75B|nr:lipopolysaccharide biosynthesis protein [Halobacterium salinarum]MDL0136576.1 lipopolysaccharide biosynthesis protein [Halobacterium salinarum]